jgi:hypothetical protein
MCLALTRRRRSVNSLTLETVAGHSGPLRFEVHYHWPTAKKTDALRALRVVPGHEPQLFVNRPVACREATEGSLPNRVLIDPP